VYTPGCILVPGLPLVRNIALAVHVHATEDERKVLEALYRLLPEEVRGRARVSKATLEGHHGNPITRIEVVVEGEDAEKTARHIASLLDDTEKRLLDASFETRFDERSGRLFLRFSKQDAYLGRLRIMDGDDVVRVVIGFRGSPSVEKARRYARELGLLP